MVRQLRSCVAVLAVLAFVGPSLAAAQGVEAPRLPLRTKLDELNTLRAAYAEAFNGKNAAAVSAMYAPDALLITDKGVLVSGHEAIAASFATDAKNWPHMVIESDSVKVFGNTAVDMGTLKMHPEGGAEIVARYLVVLRRNMQDWKLVSVASVPVAPAAP